MQNTLATTLGLLLLTKMLKKNLTFMLIKKKWKQKY